MFGLAGASRSGKSTLAAELSEATGIPYTTISTSKLAAELGYNLVGQLSITERIEAQEKLLRSYLDLIDTLPSPFIVDRTPLDMIAYTICEVSMLGTDRETGVRIKAFVDRALAATSQRFGGIIVLRPLPVYESAPDKHPDNPAYQWHTQYVIEGLIHHILSSTYVSLVPTSDPSGRLAHGLAMVNRRVSSIEALYADAHFH